MKKAMKRILLPLFAVLCMTSLSACGDTSSTKTSTNNNSETEKTSKKDGGFSFEPIKPSVDSSKSSETSKSQSISLDIEVLATIDKDGEYTIEAEDCDTSGCTLQAGCASFFEDVDNRYPTSGGTCLACISAPSILAFQFEAKADCTIEFHTVSAKYENPWSLDDNVSYYLDEDKDNPFTSNYQDFGHTDENQWYNWKDVTLGSKQIKKGVHQFNVNVKAAFPNTYCFKLIFSDYQA